jgi:ribonuclease P protein component
LSPNARLRNSADFRAVYSKGSRFEGRLVSVFILPNGLNQHRLGITASRKMSRRAVDRNRAKRLIREAFRLSEAGLNALKHRYDWVFNARRPIIEKKVDEVIKELQIVFDKVIQNELRVISVNEVGE